MTRILRREQFSESTFLWEVDAPDVARAARPGQFVMLRIKEEGERVPLTIADYDRGRGTVTVVVQAVGRTTREMLTGFAEGDEFPDFAGPLGMPSHTPRLGHVVVVGGGLGVAPIFPQVRAFKEAGNRVTAILGFRHAGLVFWEERFRTLCDRLVVCTDDGSHGRPGLVSAALSELLLQDPAQHVVAIGPLGMMRACAEVTRPLGVSTAVSLNAIMVDGTGMCGSCRVTHEGQVRFACVDGPDFPAHGVDFDELMRRQARFRDQEGRANEDLAHVCNLERQLFEEEQRNYKKIKELAPRATPMPERPAEVRVRNFDEVNLGYDLGSALVEAERCIQCSRPTCIAGCPVHIDIPRFIRHLLVRDIDGAAAVIHENNLFPSVCGRVCPQESQCEAQCVIGKKVEPVAIGRLERFVGDAAKAPAPPPRVARRGRVAVVGSGPAGLACAGDLAQNGVEVVVYEALHVVGGVLRYGIPGFRLPRDIIAREVAQLEALGVRIETNKIIGRTFTVPQLLGEMGFDAVFLGVGAGAPTFCGIPGENAGQCYSANEFLTRVNLMGGDRFPLQETPVAVGRRVVVVGAGNTAMDCLRVARRLGAEEVHCVYRRTEDEAPARKEELRHAQEEGILFHWLRSPVEIETDERGDVRAIRVQHMALGEPDASGRRKPVPVPDAFDRLPCDTVITALGTRANPILAQTTPGLQTNASGYFVADPETQATSLPGVYAGGDIVTGGATVILALGAGRRAAQGILAWLADRTWPPHGKGVPMPTPETRKEQTCPRCKRPTEDDEAYVCCAGALLSWSCTGCQKVYEGFALPYGLCPACGGEMAILNSPSRLDDSTLKAVRHAFEIELGGLAFYSRGAELTTDVSVRRLFSSLAGMERAHLATLSRRYHVSPPEATGVEPWAAALYAGLTPPEDDGLALVKLALALERRARGYFQAHAEDQVEGTPVWKLYRELQAEEGEHVVLLENELSRLQQGLAGLL